LSGCIRECLPPPDLLPRRVSPRLTNNSHSLYENKFKGGETVQPHITADGTGKYAKGQGGRAGGLSLNDRANDRAAHARVHG